MALVDARRDRDPQRPGPLDAAFALAGLAWRLDDRSVAAALGARRDVAHLAEHRVASRSDLAPAVALGAGRGARAGLRPRPAAGLAATVDRELDLLLDPED